MGVVLLLAIAGAITMHVLKPKWHDEYGERFTDIAYGSREHNTYDLYLPHDAASKDSLALMLFIHGGSWLGGDKTDHNGDCYKWVQKGYATASMNYSLLTEEGTSFLTMLDEIEACIRHIKSFAEEKGVRIRPVIRDILRMGIFQILYMDAVPDSAACNEAVKLTRLSGKNELSGFVNGVLRTIVREKEKGVFAAP